MHIETEIATSAVAITMGMHNYTSNDNLTQLLQEWSEGMVENYAQIGELAVISCTMANEIAQLEAMKYHGFPGVYAYEVEEELGKAIIQFIDRGELRDKAMTDELVKTKLAELAWQFFSQGDTNEDFPTSQIKAVILKHTGVEV